MSRLELRGLQKRFGDHLAVDVAELELPSGELSVLLGPSGCGKTTLLRILAGFERPDAGCVSLDDRLLTAPGRHVPPEDRGIGMVFQDQALFPHLRVAENIAFGLPRSRGARAQRRKRVEELVELVGLDGLAQRFPHELSGGQQQRVALARALAPAPGILLLDEPFSGLDLETRVRIRGEVQRILEAANATALLVTHDQDEALSLARLLLVMRDGVVVQRGAPAEVYREPATPWVAGFLGDVDLLPGTASAGVVRCELGPLDASTMPDGPVEIAVRPECIGIVDEPADGHVRGRLQRTEFFGHDLVLHLVTDGGTELRSRVMGPAVLSDAERWAALPPGSELGLALIGEARIYGAGQATGARSA